VSAGASESTPAVRERSEPTIAQGHRILVCVGRSALADNCLPYAISLARVLRSDLTIVHVMQPRRDVTGSGTDAVDWEISRQEAHAYLVQLQQEAASALERPVDIRLEQGHAAERIVELAREIHAELTVLGGHGEDGVAAWGLGSTAHQVIAVSRGSVFVTHTSSASPIAVAPRTVLVPLDGSRRTESMLPEAVHLARAYSAELVLVHVVHEQLPTAVLCRAEDLERARELAAHLEIQGKAYLEGLRATLIRDGAVVRTLVLRHANERRAILELSEREHADLIVVAAHGATCDRARTFGSVTEYLFAHSRVPLLVLQDLRDAELPVPDPGARRAPPLRGSFVPGLG